MATDNTTASGPRTPAELIAALERADAYLGRVGRLLADVSSMGTAVAALGEAHAAQKEVRVALAALRQPAPLAPADAGLVETVREYRDALASYTDGRNDLVECDERTRKAHEALLAYPLPTPGAAPADRKDETRMKPFARYVIGGLSGDDPGNLVRVFLAQLEPDLRDELVKIVDALRNETAWVIERDIDSTLHYWTGRAIHREPADPDRLGEWSPDVNRALRFARRADAACMLTWHCQDIGRVAEHLWIAGRAHYRIGCGHHWTGATPGTVCGDCWRDAQKAISDVRVLRAELESAAERDACRIVDQHAHRDLGQRYAGLVALVREWQAARKPATLSAPGEFLAETFQAAVRRMSAADEALAAYQLDGPAGGALVGQSAPTESTGAYLCACTCGCENRTIRPGRCMVCRVREDCLKNEWTCEACALGYRLGPWDTHYDHDDATWGVCRKVVASFRRAEP